VERKKKLETLGEKEYQPILPSGMGTN